MHCYLACGVRVRRTPNDRPTKNFFCSFDLLASFAGSFTNLGTNVLYTNVVVIIFLLVLHTIFSTLYFEVGLPGPLECVNSSFSGRFFVSSVELSAVTVASFLLVPISDAVMLAVSTLIVSCVFVVLFCALCSLLLVAMWVSFVTFEGCKGLMPR